LSTGGYCETATAGRTCIPFAVPQRVQRLVQLDLDRHFILRREFLRLRVLLLLGPAPRRSSSLLFDRDPRIGHCQSDGDDRARCGSESKSVGLWEKDFCRVRSRRRSGELEFASIEQEDLYVRGVRMVGPVSSSQIREEEEIEESAPPRPDLLRAQSLAGG
jgi:hypothetical protein